MLCCIMVCCVCGVCVWCVCVCVCVCVHWFVCVHACVLVFASMRLPERETESGRRFLFVNFYFCYSIKLCFVATGVLADHMK